jgi:hypothetical protein
MAIDPLQSIYQQYISSSQPDPSVAPSQDDTYRARWQAALERQIDPRRTLLRNIAQGLQAFGAAAGSTPGNAFTGIGAGLSAGAQGFHKANVESDQTRLQSLSALQQDQQSQKDEMLKRLYQQFTMGSEMNKEDIARKEADARLKYWQQRGTGGGGGWTRASYANAMNGIDADADAFADANGFERRGPEWDEERQRLKEERGVPDTYDGGGGSAAVSPEAGKGGSPPVPGGGGVKHPQVVPGPTGALRAPPQATATMVADPTALVDVNGTQLPASVAYDLKYGAGSAAAALDAAKRQPQIPDPDAGY